MLHTVDNEAYSPSGGINREETVAQGQTPHSDTTKGSRSMFMSSPLLVGMKILRTSVSNINITQHGYAWICMHRGIQRGSMSVLPRRQECGLRVLVSDYARICGDLLVCNLFGCYFILILLGLFDCFLRCAKTVILACGQGTVSIEACMDKLWSGYCIQIRILRGLSNGKLQSLSFVESRDLESNLLHSKWARCQSQQPIQ